MNQRIETGHSGERLRDVPELVENICGQCVQIRTEALGMTRELGPPDLIHLVKTASTGTKTTSKEVSSYHYVLGVDTSSSASIAAYVNSLTYSLETSIGWFRTNPWKITRSVYCSYNAFSGVDVRVEARIPGGVTAYAITASGTKIPTTTEIWQETFVSSILRAIHQSKNYVIGLRRLEALPTEISERRFLEAAARLFHSAWQLGAAAGQPVGTNVNNFLVTGIWRYFYGCQRALIALDFFTPFAKIDPEVNAIMAQCLLAADREPEAIQLLHKTITDQTGGVANPLIVQCEFLQSKRRFKEAVEIGRSAVKAAPVDYLAWTTLARAFIHLEDYESAIIALNTCPVTLSPESQPLNPLPTTKVWIPRKDDAPIDKVSNVACPDSILERLRAPGLKGAVGAVYGVLVELVRVTGWDALLELRSRIFLMEDEYREQRNNSNSATAAARKDSSHLEEENVPLEMQQKDEEGDNGTLVKESNNGNALPIMEEVSLNNNDKIAEPKAKSNTTLPVKKRLCERWLNNLFMILFEDMRVYTIYRGELAHFRAENMPYQRTAREWLVLGTLCRRLGYLDEAKEALRQCVEKAFCADAWLSLLEIYSTEGRLAHALTAAAKLLVYEAGHYITTLYPSPVGEIVYELIRKHGAERVKMTMVTLNLGTLVDGLIQRYLDAALTQKALGYDY